MTSITAETAALIKDAFICAYLEFANFDISKYNAAQIYAEDSFRQYCLAKNIRVE